jgi:hypothetical protein
MLLKKAKNLFIGCFDGGLFAIGDGFGMDRVAIVVIEEEDVVVATDGGYYKATSLIGANLAGDGMAVSINVMGAMARTLVIEW